MKTKESMIKNAAILCLATLLAFSAVILIKGWIRCSFRSIDSLRGYVASFGIWAPVVLTLIQLFLTILPVCTSFVHCRGLRARAVGANWPVQNARHFQ